MSRMTSGNMTGRVQPVGTNMPKRSATPTMPSAGGKKSTIAVPKGGEVHVRKIDNGHIAVVRDSNYNTVSETYVADTGQLRLE